MHIAIHIIVSLLCVLMEVVNMGGPNIVLDHELLDQCRKLTGIKTTRALVDYALHELRRLALQKGLMELKG